MLLVLALFCPLDLIFTVFFSKRFLRTVVQNHTHYLDTLSLWIPGTQSIATCLCLIQAFPGESGENLTESELCAF